MKLKATGRKHIAAIRRQTSKFQVLCKDEEQNRKIAEI
jgi:hypothetical protein